MRLEGIHHITAITGDARGNLDFYVRAMGLRLVKKTINYDVPDVYHLYYGDDRGSAGSILTFFEYPGAGRGVAGAGMIYRIGWRVRDSVSLDWWQSRIESEGLAVERDEGRLSFSDPEGLGVELVPDVVGDSPLVATSSHVDVRNALLGFEGVRAYATAPGHGSYVMTSLLGMVPGELGYALRGDRTAIYYEDPAPPVEPDPLAGTVHHIAWACLPEHHVAWRTRLMESGIDVTPIMDRTYFRSIYFREPNGVLFEIATIGPGFAVDEDEDRLGESLVLPAHLAHLRPQLEASLTRLPTQVDGSGSSGHPEQG